MKKGLVIKHEWLEMILDKNKLWEIRGSDTSYRGKVYFIKSKSGQVFGEGNLICTHKLNEESYRMNYKLHKVFYDFKMLPYKNVYAWVFDIASIKRYKKPIPYTHPQGAVIWINLDENNCTQLFNDEN